MAVRDVKGTEWIVGITHVGGGVWQIQARLANHFAARDQAEVVNSFHGVCTVQEQEQVYRQAQDAVAHVLNDITRRMDEVYELSTPLFSQS